MYAIKAWLAAIGAFLATFLDEWTGGQADPLQPRDYVVAALAGVIMFGAVFTIPNKPPSQ